MQHTLKWIGTYYSSYRFTVNVTSFLFHPLENSGLVYAGELFRMAVNGVITEVIFQPEI